MTLLRSLRPTILDRYVAREILPPTALGLLLFTFVLLLDNITNLMKLLVSRGADFPTVVRAFVYILPSIFSVTIPMAFLLGVLLAFGRLASDSEIVALRASGVSPARLLRPVMGLSAVAAVLTFYVVAVALPVANQAYREIVFSLVVSKANAAMKPRVFSDDLVPGMVVYVSDIPAAKSGRWRDVFLHDLRNPRRPQVVLARGGRLVIEKDTRRVALFLEKGVTYAFHPTTPEQDEVSQFSSASLPLPFEEFFPRVPLAKGDREMSLDELRSRVAELQAQGRPRLEWGRFAVEIHKKYAIPAACFVFGLLGLGLSLGSKKEARSAAFGLSIVVIFIYYVMIRLGEQAGDTDLLHPFVGMWAANAIMGAIAVTLLVLNHREAAFDPLDPSHYAALLPRVRRPGEASAPVVVRPLPARRPVVVVRVPRLSLPLPGIIDRYLARAYTGHFAMVLTAFWSLFVLVSFIDLVDDMNQNRVKGAVLLHYYAFETPSIVYLLTPLAILVAVLITFGVMSRRNEMTALKAAGVSLYRASLPVLGMAGLTSVLMFGAAEFMLPFFKKVANQDFNVIKGRPPQSSNIFERRWILGSDDRIYNYDFLERGPAAGGITLHQLSVYDVDPKSWMLQDRLFANRASWNGVSYDLERGWRRTFLPAPGFRAFEQGRTREIEPPHYFRQEDRETETLGLRELRAYIARLEMLGLDVVALRVQLHRKVAYPAVCLVMTLLGIPFAFVVARRGALYGIAASILIAIVYWASLAIFEAFGNAAVLPAALAAWGPNVIFGTAGLYLMFTLQT